MENAKMLNLINGEEKMNKKSKKKGFSLVELIIVIAILGILAAIITPNVMKFTNSAKVSKAVSDAKTIVSAIDAYNAEQVGGTGSSAAIGKDEAADSTKIIGSTGSIKSWPSEFGTGVTYTQLTIVADKANYVEGTPTDGKWSLDSSGNVTFYSATK